MDDQERYDRFVSALGFRAGFADGPAGAVELTDLDGEPVEPAVRLHVDARTLGEHVRDDEGLTPTARRARDAELVDLDEEDAPDELDDPEAARLQSLIAQIEEAILVRRPGQDHLVLVDGGVKAVSGDDLGAPTV
jgi:hypothetical protein